MTTANGNYIGVQYERGELLEYAEVDEPLELAFEFNPATMTRTRSVSIRTGQAPGTLGGYDFADRSEAPRASQGISVNAESFTVTILLDATDRMNAGDNAAAQFGVQPELDTIRSLLEPKTATPEGERTLAALGEGSERAFSRHQYASVLLFHWGPHLLPVFMTQAQVEVSAWLPSLYPYRAQATLTLQIIESDNRFYREEVKRQFGAATRGAGENEVV